MKQPRGEDGAAGTILAASRDEQASRRRPGRPSKYPAVVEFNCDGCGTPSSQQGYVYHRGTSPLHFCAKCAHDGTANRVRDAARIAERRRQVAELYPELRPEAIAERLGVSESTIHADVNALAQEGVLEKAPQWPAREQRICALDGCEEPVTHYGRNSYHSIGCWYAARQQRRAGKTSLCKCGCGREVYRMPSRVRSSGVFFSNECAGRYGVEHGTRGAFLKSMHRRGLLRGRRAQKLLGMAAPKPGRLRNDSHRDWALVLERIQELYEETNATERELMNLYRQRWGVPEWGKPVSKRVVRLALNRPV